MAQKWYQKASNQAAIITGLGVLVVGLIQILWVERARSENDDLKREIGKKTSENQRLETLLVPFRTIALERYSGTEAEALSKLAEKIRTIEGQLGDVNRLRELAAKHEYKPLKAELRQSIVNALSTLKQRFAEQSINVEITYETWASPPTREFAKQLADLLKEGGIGVTGPDFATIYLVGPAYALELEYSKEQLGLASALFEVLSQAIKPSERYARRDSLQKDKIRLHSGGQVVFQPDGTITVQ